MESSLAASQITIFSASHVPRTAQFFAKFAESAAASALLIRTTIKTALLLQPPVKASNPSAFLKVFSIFRELYSQISGEGRREMETSLGYPDK
jgi:hypothetical protein